MPRFCSACGAAIPDGSTFCTNCGAPQAQTPQPQAPQYQQPAPQFQQQPNPQFQQQAPAPQYQQQAPAPQYQQPGSGSDSAAYSMLNAVNGPGQPIYPQSAAAAVKPHTPMSPKTKKILILGCACVAALAVIIILLVILLGGGYKKPVDNLVKSLETGKGEYYVKCLPEVEQKDLEERKVAESSKYDTLAEYYDDKLDSANANLIDRYGNDFSISYSITEKKELTDSQLKSYASEYKYNYDKKVDVSAGYKIYLEVTWKGPDKEEVGDKYVTVLKVDGDWVLYDADYDIMMPKKLGGVNNSSGSSSSSDYDLGDLDDYLDYFS